MHLRYLEPTAGGYSNTTLPWPVVFWACKADEGTKMSNNPFDRTNLGYDGLFGDRTMFYHARSALKEGQIAMENVRVPVLDLHWSAVVQWGTTIAIAVGFFWICWTVIAPIDSISPRKRRHEKAKSDEKKVQ